MTKNNGKATTRNIRTLTLTFFDAFFLPLTLSVVHALFSAIAVRVYTFLFSNSAYTLRKSASRSQANPSYTHTRCVCCWYTNATINNGAA